MLECSNKFRFGAALSLVLLALALAYKKEETERAEAGSVKSNNPEKASCDDLMRAPEANSRQTGDAKKAKKRFWVDYEPIEIFSFFLMLATIGLVFIGSLQVWTFIESERPFLGVPGILVAGNGFKANLPVAFIVIVKNSGKTTAFVTDARVLVHTQPKRTPILQSGLEKFFAPTVAKGPVLAGDSNTFISQPNVGGRPLVFDQSAIDTLDHTDAYLWVIGYVTYKDQFPLIGTTTTVGFCYLWNPHPVDVRAGPFNRCGSEEYEYQR